jgi:hypothetical protein
MVLQKQHARMSLLPAAEQKSTSTKHRSNMPQQFIHVKIGLTDGIYPVREFITTGLMHDMYEFQQDEHTIGWVHKRWCTPVSATQAPSGSVTCCGLQAAESVSTTADWRKFLREHWDAEHNHCQAEHLNEFYAIFRRAAANYINSIQIKHEQEIKRQHVLQGNHQHGGHEQRRADTVPHPTGGQRSAASLPSGDTTKVRTEAVAAHRHKPVELSLFPDL